MNDMTHLHVSTWRFSQYNALFVIALFARRMTVELRLSSFIGGDKKVGGWVSVTGSAVVILALLSHHCCGQ